MILTALQAIQEMRFISLETSAPAYQNSLSIEYIVVWRSGKHAVITSRGTVRVYGDKTSSSLDFSVGFILPLVSSTYGGILRNNDPQ